MTRHVLLLRAINVGGRNKLPMARLKAAISTAGGRQPQTYIQSGNAIFDGDVSEPALRSAIEAEAGFAPDQMLFTAADFQARCEANPFCAIEDDKSVHAYLMTSDTPDGAETRLEALCAPSETVRLIGQTLWLHAPDGIGRSKLVSTIEKALGVSASGRNYKTLKAILALLGA